jgi:RNA polymerase sigma factor (sigma-70 family)
MGSTMSIGDESKTSPTLLGRLATCPPDQAAWNEFVDRYGPRILHWCRAWGLQEADIMDVSQSVLAKLSVQLRNFHYDPSRSFRGWLRSVVRNAAHDATAARLKLADTGGTDLLHRLASVEARDDLVRRLDDEFDLELLDTATAAVRQRVTAKSWEAYQLTASEDRSAVTVAATLGMSVGAVYQAKSRIMQMIQDEVRRLGSHLGDGGEIED